MLPFSFNYNHLTMESFILELNQLFFRNALSWGCGATSDLETSDVETGDAETSD